MGRLLVTALCSLDGYVADTEGSFEFAFPSPEVHQAVNDLERPVGTQLLGRRTHEVMTYWDTAPTEGDDPEADFARIWAGVDKVVYSGTLADVTAPRTRLERSFDAEAVRALVAASPHDVEIGGPTLAAEAWRAGLVDEVRLFLMPVVVGGGLPALPLGVRTRLHLLDQRTYPDGTVLVRHAVQH
ncbi:MAG: dihydrofolate reductase family protein [Candidatus Nanopelagicales bacterium]